MAKTLLTLQRTHTLLDGGTVLEARTSDGQRVTVWYGAPIYDSAGNHPGLAEPLFSGAHEGHPIWIESRPGPWALRDLESPLGEADALALICALADALASLHAMGRCHGSISEDHIVLHSDGSPCLIGVGRIGSSQEQDIIDMLSLLQRLHPIDAIPDGIVSASGLAAKLREWGIERNLTESVLADQLTKQGRPRTTEDRTIVLNTVPLGHSDEVQPDIGNDAKGRGILDRWSAIESSGEITEDPTETAELPSHRNHVHQTVLGRITEILLQADERYGEGFAPPGAHFRAHLLNEPLDPLPVSNGLEHGTLHNPLDRSEKTAEISQPDVTNPSLELTDETTGITGGTDGVPIQPSVLTGLLWATVIGMLSAAVMLLAVWVIISGVF